MRVTNNMIMKNASSNINSTKETVNKRNTQMTTQKKISSPSEDPVVAVRSLRLSTSLSTLGQYYEKNIPDATSWLDVTETALINMRTVVSDCRSLVVTGSTDTYSAEDRNTLATQLTQLQQQLYAEGNADYAGRTVFTGFRTDCNLTFTENEADTKYRITQTLSTQDAMESYRYYSGQVSVPTDENTLINDAITDISVKEYSRIRLNYDNIDSIDNMSIKWTDDQGVDHTVSYKGTLDAASDSYLADVDGTTDDGTYTLKVYESADDWAQAGDKTTITTGEKTVGDDEIVVIRETGEMIFGKNIAAEMKKYNATVEVEYDKTGFGQGELRPEYYYNCSKRADSDPTVNGLPITYTKYDENGNVVNYDINYTIAANQTIAVNTEASSVFDSSLSRDLSELVTAVKNTITAHDKVDKIKSMMSDTQFASDEDQTKLNEWLEAAQKEADYADDNMQKLYSTELGKIDKYYSKINLAVTDLGCKTDSLTLTKTRVGDQQETTEELQSQNDDLDLSSIIIDYTAAYTAYQASLQAASKLGSTSLLNYL